MDYYRLRYGDNYDVKDARQMAEQMWPDAFEPEWPSEQQVIDWNIHNDHADGLEAELDGGEWVWD